MPYATCRRCSGSPKKAVDSRVFALDDLPPVELALCKSHRAEYDRLYAWWTAESAGDLDADDCRRCTFSNPRRGVDTRTLRTTGHSECVLRLCRTHRDDFLRAWRKWHQVGEIVDDSETQLDTRDNRTTTHVIRRLRQQHADQQAETNVRVVRPRERSGGDHRTRDWFVTRHAQQRAAERGFDLAQVVAVAATPSVVLPDKKHDDRKWHIAGDIHVVTNPHDKVVITVMTRFEALCAGMRENG